MRFGGIDARIEVVSSEILVIGYGNLLRGDDGLGQFIVCRLAARRWPGVRTLAVHQLLPELAEELTECGLAVFVDARKGGDGNGVTVTALAPIGTAATSAHHCDPASLLALTQALYGQIPPALWVTVAGEDFRFQEGLSPAARRNARAALGRIESLIGAEGLKCA
jgi:hydrogenase maturation protease